MRHATALSLLAFCFAGCSLQAPEIKVTGERSLLERQVFGAYQGLTEDLWMLTSQRAAADSLALGAERDRLLQALRRRQFNRDDRLRGLEEGRLGEDSSGRLVLRGAAAAEETPDPLALRLLRQEAEDRRVLLERLLALHPDSDVAELTRIFAGIQQEECPAGGWIETESGEWLRK